MTTTVVDSSNLAQMVAEATGEPYEAPAGDKPAAEKGADPKKPVEAKVEDQDDADDVEGDDGLTTRQKRELSGKMLKAIGKKHREVKEAEEFAAHQLFERQQIAKQASDLQERLNAMEAKAKAKPAEKTETTEPKREDFATDSEYLRASIDYGVERAWKQREAEVRKAEAEQSMQTQYARAKELVPDFEQTVSKNLNYPGPVVEYMQGSEMFAEIGYHFAKHPAELEKLSKMPPVRQLVALGKIEATLRPFGKAAEAAPKGAEEAQDGKGAKPAPSDVDTGLVPSKARSDAPVIKPLSSSDGAQVQPDVRDMNIRQSIEAFQRSKGINFHARKRH